MIFLGVKSKTWQLQYTYCFISDFIHYLIHQKLTENRCSCLACDGTTRATTALGDGSFVGSRGEGGLVQTAADGGQCGVTPLQ